MLKSKKLRDSLLKYLISQNIFADKSYYPLLHFQPALKREVKINIAILKIVKKIQINICYFLVIKV